MSDKGYDEDCAELARKFLPYANESLISAMALAIQSLIESWDEETGEVEGE